MTSIATLHPEIKSRSPRGIHAYGRSLISNLGQQSNWLVTDNRPDGPASGPEDRIIHGLINPPNGGGSSLRSLPGYLRHQLGPAPRSQAISLSQELADHPTLDYLAAVDGFINLPGFYEICRLAGNKPGLCEVDLDFLHRHRCGIAVTSTPMAVRYKKGRLVQTVHDLIILNEDMHELNRAKFRRRLDSCIRRSDVIIAVSQHTRNEILQRYPEAEERVRVIYQPLPSNTANIERSLQTELQDEVLEKFHLQSQKYIFFVGAIEPRKNIARLIQAFLNSPLTHEYQLVLAGSLDASYAKRENFAHWLQPGSKPSEKRNIRYLGMISDMEKLCLLRNARVFVFPSLAEGFGIPVLEAQAMGCPVLTSNTSALPEVAGNAAVMVHDPSNVEELTFQLTRAAQDDALNGRLRQEGLANSARFHKDVFAQQLNSLIHSL